LFISYWEIKNCRVYPTKGFLVRATDLSDPSITFDFVSMNQAAKKLKLGVTNISKVCRGEFEQTGGYRFVYI
jgi:hypothetical protein